MAIRIMLLAAAMHTRLVLAGAMIVAAAMRAGFVVPGFVSFAVAIVTWLMLAAGVFFTAAVDAKHGGSPCRLECWIFGVMEYRSDGVLECWSDEIWEQQSANN